MDRRTFFKKSIGASVAVGSYFSTGQFRELIAFTPGSYDLVAIKGGEPDAMFDKGIQELGGMKAFIKKGQKVVIKPNIGWDVSPERAGNTNPRLISRIINHCSDAGAKEIIVVDHTCDEWQRCYKNSGIERAVKDAGGKIAPGGSESYYHDVKIPKGKSLTSAKEHEVILGADVFINVPILKNHSGTSLTIAMKNLMGNVWDRRYWHGNDLHQCIADFATYRKPDLNIVDAYNVMKSNGPRGVSTEDVVTMKAQLISTDMVAIDAAAAKLFGIKPEDVRHIQIAADLKVGRMDLEKLNIKRITV
ncbi:MAG: DUF362 domain-containing protein [Ignavibacteriales bacterium]|nr:DUF362 domain-containing protein [Ignavibacteriales bacterium]